MSIEAVRIPPLKQSLKLKISHNVCTPITLFSFQSSFYAQACCTQSSSKCGSSAQNAHANKRKSEAQGAIMSEVEALTKKLQRHARQDASRAREEAAVQAVARRGRLAGAGEAQPQGGDGRAQRLRRAAQQRSPDDGLGARLQRQVQRQRHREALCDVVDEQR